MIIQFSAFGGSGGGSVDPTQVQMLSGRVSSITLTATHDEYPTAKAVYDAVSSIDTDSFEDRKNKVTSFSGNVTDRQYPSAKLVKDAIKDNENVVAQALTDVNGRIGNFVQSIEDETIGTMKITNIVFISKEDYDALAEKDNTTLYAILEE